MDAFVQARREARTGSGWYAALARTGLTAKGVSYGLVGVLAICLAAGVGGEATSRQGALQQLAGTGVGTVVIVLLAIGFAAYAAWRVAEAVAADEDGEAKTWAKRAASIGRAVVYAALAVSAIRILAGAGGGGSQNGKAHKATAVVLAWPGGTWIVGTAGAVVIGVGLWNLYRGLTRKFEERWRSGSDATRWGGRAGVVGHVARCIVFALIGVFAIKAALDYNPKDAVGMDGALQKLAHASYGPYLLGLTAAGLVAYGVYCLVDARYRDVSV